ncbi:uncharacterized protein VNE69_06109 [Vairimorpha necatrix]|uniref:Uncharacterized protein n=1 Tax=Vairimorpha necatrix TaxID=6039 RepID=A0AAX4JCW0_9MICR
MNIITIMFSFIIIHTTQIAFEKMQNNQRTYENIKNMIISKKENRDYVQFNAKEQFNKITIFFNEKSKIFYLDIEKHLSGDCNYNVEKFGYYFDNKSIHEISEDIEHYLVLNLKNLTTYSKILMYDPYNFCTCPTMKEVIENIKSINKKRRVNKKAWEIYYEHICEKDSYLLEKLHETEHKTTTNEDSIDMYKVYFFHKEETHDEYVRFYIESCGIYYLFELNSEEIEVETFYTLSDANIRINDKRDEDILNKLLKICKLSDIYGIETFFIPFQFICTSCKIEIPNINFILEIESDKISIKQTYGYYFYYTTNDMLLEYNHFFIEKKNFIEFKQILKKISEINNIECFFKGVEMFFRILRRHNKIETIMAKILKNKGSPLNILSVHLLLSGNIINQIEFNLLLELEEDTNLDSIISHIIEILMTNYKIINSLHFYLIKICLLLESESYMNDDEVDGDKLFGTLLEIINLSKDKTYTREYDSGSKKENFSLVKIIEEKLSIHINNIHNFKFEVLVRFCKMILLFTELNNFEENKYHQLNHNNDRFINYLGFDKNNIEINAKIILKKLSENAIVERKYEEARNKKIKEMEQYIKIFLNDDLIAKLKKIILMGLNANIENKFDENGKIKFENELIIEAMKEIAETYNYHENEILALNINKESVVEYKTDLEKKIKKAVTEYVNENYKTNAIKELPRTMMTLFESNFINDKRKKEESEDKLNFIHKILNKHELIEIMNNNSGVELTDILITAIKD